MDVKIETVSPMHIGNGSSYGPLESYIDGETLHRVDMNALFDQHPEFIKDYVSAVKNKNITGIEMILKKGNIRYSIRSVAHFKILEEKILENIKDGNSDAPYIPGSTIKGFIRTALIVKYLKDNGWNFELSINGSNQSYNLWSAMQNGINNLRIARLMGDRDLNRYKKANKNFGSRFEEMVVFIGECRESKCHDRNGFRFKYDAKYDIFKYLQVSDFYPIKYEMWVDKVVISQLRRIEQFLEVFTGEFKGSITLNPSIRSALKNSKEYPLLQRKLKILGINVKDLEDLKSAERRVFDHIKRAVAEYVEDVRRYESKVLNREVRVSGANLRLGFGTGFLYKTIWVYMVENLPDYLIRDVLRSFEKHRADPNRYPKSRHLLSDGTELGWANIG